MQLYYEIDGQDLCSSCTVERIKEKSEVKQDAETRARDDDYAEF